MKNLFSMLLCVTICLAFGMPMAISADTNTSLHTFTYEILSDGTISITGFTENTSSNPSLMVIPSSVDGYTVSAIGEGAFHRTDGIDTVVIADTVKTIGAAAFQESDFKHVFIGAGVETIALQAFFCCYYLQTLVIPSSVTTIGERAIGFARYTDPEYPDLLPGTPAVVPGFMIYTNGSNNAANVYAEKTGVSLKELSNVLCGDINFDNIVNTSDARTMLQYLLISDIASYLSTWCVADVNADGEFSTDDARVLLTSVVSQ